MLDAKLSDLNSKQTSASEESKPAALPILTFVVPTQSVDENVGTVSVTIQSLTPISSDITFNLSVSGSALASGVDYILPSNQVTMTAGTSSKQINLTIVDDATQENNEDIVLTIPASSDYALGNYTTATIIVNANDAPPCNTGITTNFGGGDGSAGNPYRICNLDQWSYFGTTTSSWTQNIKLESDLDFNGISFAQLKLIGTIANPFTGVFDGNDFAIKNININSGASKFGLFSRTDGNATIKKLKLETITYASSTPTALLVDTHEVNGTLNLQNITLTSVTSSSSNSGLVATAKGPLSVSNVTVNTFSTQIGAAIGMIAGSVSSSSTFQNISAQSVTMNVFSGTGIFYGTGGIVGSSPPNATARTLTFNNITIAINLGSGSFSYRTGGIIGQAYDVNLSITNCNVTGTFSGRNIGGLVGTFANSTSPAVTGSISNSSYNGTMSTGNAGGAGLVAESAGTLTIDKSFTKGSVTNSSSAAAGLVNYAYGNTTVTDSYSQMTLSATSGGLTGGLVANISSSVTLNLTRSYFSGSVTSTGTKGCAYASNSGTVNLSGIYYNSSVCTVSAAGTAGTFTGSASGLATALFQTATPFSGWLTSVWTFASGANPKLAYEP